MTFTSDELRRYGLRSIAEAINFLSLGVITSDGLRTPDIGSRGVLLAQDDGKHFLLLVNGHAINDPLYGAARFDQGAGIPLDLVDRIEVIVGPGSVLYGSNAMLGVVNVITKSAKDYEGGHVYGDYELGARTRQRRCRVHLRLFGEASELTTSFEYYRRFGPDIEFERARTGLFFNGELARYRRGGPSDGVWGGTASDAYFTEAPSGMLRLRVGDFDIAVMASAYRRGIPYMTGSTNVDFDDAESYELDRALRLDVQHQATLSSLLALSSRVYADHFDYQRRLNRDAVTAAIATTWRPVSTTTPASRAGSASRSVSRSTGSRSEPGDVARVDAACAGGGQEEAVDFDSGGPLRPPPARYGGRGAHQPVPAADLEPDAFPGYQRRRAPRLRSAFRSDRFAAWSAGAEPVLADHVQGRLFAGVSRAHLCRNGFQLVPAGKIGRYPAGNRAFARGQLEQRFGAHRLCSVCFGLGVNLIEARGLSPAEREQLQLDGKLPITAIQVSQYRNVASIENYGYNAVSSGTFLDSRLSYTLNATAAFTRRKARDGSTRQLEVAPQVFGNARLSYAFGGLIPTPSLAARYVGENAAARVSTGRYSSVPKSIQRGVRAPQRPVPAQWPQLALERESITAKRGRTSSGGQSGWREPRPSAADYAVDQSEP